MTEATPQNLDYAAPVAGPRPAVVLLGWLKRLAPLVGLICVTSLFSALRPDTFATAENAQIVLTQTAVVGTAALGMTIIIIAGGIDLSVGSAIALCTVVVASVLSRGLPPAIAAATSVAAGAAIGLAIGAMVIGHLGRVIAVTAPPWLALALHDNAGLSWWASIAVAAPLFPLILFASERFIRRLELTPFIITLGMLAILRGMAQLVAPNGRLEAPETWLNDVLNKFGAFNYIFPPGVWVMLVLALLVAGVLRYTQFGRHVFAIGSNEKTARLCGVAVERTKLLVYAFAGALNGVAGVLLFSYNTMGDSTAANGLELNVIAAVVIGGASLAGGEGTVLGSLIGALLMTVVANGCTKMEHLPPPYQRIVTGVIIILAVALDRLRHRRAE